MWEGHGGREGKGGGQKGWGDGGGGRGTQGTWGGIGGRGATCGNPGGPGGLSVAIGVLGGGGRVCSLLEVSTVGRAWLMGGPWGHVRCSGGAQCVQWGSGGVR